MFSSTISFVVNSDSTVTGDTTDVLAVVFVATVSGAGIATGGHSGAVNSSAIGGGGGVYSAGPEMAVASLVKGSAISEATIDKEGAGG